MTNPGQSMVVAIYSSITEYDSYGVVTYNYGSVRILSTTFINSIPPSDTPLSIFALGVSIVVPSSWATAAPTADYSTSQAQTTTFVASYPTDTTYDSYPTNPRFHLFHLGFALSIAVVVLIGIAALIFICLAFRCCKRRNRPPYPPTPPRPIHPYPTPYTRSHTPPYPNPTPRQPYSPVSHPFDQPLIGMARTNRSSEIPRLQHTLPRNASPRNSQLRQGTRSLLPNTNQSTSTAGTTANSSSQLNSIQTRSSTINSARVFEEVRVPEARQWPEQPRGRNKTPVPELEKPHPSQTLSMARARIKPYLRYNLRVIRSKGYRQSYSGHRNMYDLGPTHNPARFWTLPLNHPEFIHQFVLNSKARRKRKIWYPGEIHRGEIQDNGPRYNLDKGTSEKAPCSADLSLITIKSARRIEPNQSSRADAEGIADLGPTFATPRFKVPAENRPPGLKTRVENDSSSRSLRPPSEANVKPKPGKPSRLLHSSPKADT